MKKLMFATALAASAAAFADGPINAISFEGYSADQRISSGAGDIPDVSGGDGTAYFWFDGTDDGSLVKTYGGDNLAAPTITRPLYFASADPNAKYLELSTEGGTLWRSIGQASSADLGTAQAVAADGTYLDTLVQFTPTEDGGAPELTQDDKLAIWLNVDSSGATPVTNLMVRAGSYDDSMVLGSASFVLSGKAVVAGEWYRLTVKAVDNILPSEDVLKIPGFTVYIDGTAMTATVSPISTTLLNGLKEAEQITTEQMAELASGKYLPSLLAGEQGTTSTLQGVGFKGSGALDDIVWTEEDPFDAPAVDFTLTWPEGITPVSYSIDGGTPVAVSGTSPATISGVAAGSTVAFTFRNADGATKTKSVEVAAGVTGIDVTGETFGWPEYLGDAVAGAYTIDDANDLDMLRKGVAAGLATVGETFNQTANIDMSQAGPFAGIGTYAANLTAGVAFCGTYDGQGFKISDIDFTQRNYGGVFNQVKGGTIKNLTVDTITCSTFSSSANDGEWGCAIVGNAGLGATLQGLTAMGSFGSAATPCTHNVAGIAIRVCGGASNVVDGVTMLETLVKDCTNNATLYGAYTKCAGITALTQDQNGVPNDYVLYDGCVNNANIAMVAGKGTEGRDGLAGILGYVSDGTKIKDCVNAGTLTSVLATAKIGGLVGWAQGRTLDDLGGNTVPADQKMVGDQNGSTITGFKYATVADNKATTVTTLAKDTTYLLEGNVAASETPVFTLAAEGDTIAFDAALGYTFAGTIAAGEGLTVSDATVGTVTTYTAAAAASGDYKVEIDGSDVVITPTAEDFDAMVAVVPSLDTNDVAAVNALLAQNIEGTTIPVWQAAFLGVEPTTNGLEQVAIKSISFDENGKVVVEMADGVSLKTGRGVTINLVLKASDDLSTWTTLQTVTDTKDFTPITPAANETKKFYKVVVEYAGSSN